MREALIKPNNTQAKTKKRQRMRRSFFRLEPPTVNLHPHLNPRSSFLAVFSSLFRTPLSHPTNHRWDGGKEESLSPTHKYLCTSGRTCLYSSQKAIFPTPRLTLKNFFLSLSLFLTHTDRIILLYTRIKSDFWLFTLPTLCVWLLAFCVFDVPSLFHLLL